MADGWNPPEVGARASRSRAVTAEDIERFTAISGDRNPLHYDEAAAGASRFGEIIVQGGITSAILNAVVAEDLPGPGTVFLEVAWKFTAPVRPGDTITGEVEVTDARADKPITHLRTTVTRDDGVVALEGTPFGPRDTRVTAQMVPRSSVNRCSPSTVSTRANPSRSRTRRLGTLSTSHHATAAPWPRDAT